MACVVFDLLLAFALVVGARCSNDVRLVDAAGGLSSVGLLQVTTDMGFGTVCGANAAAAEAARPETLQSAPCQFAARSAFVFEPNWSTAFLLMLSMRRIGPGDLQIDGLCARLHQQLPMWILRWCGPVRRGRGPSGVLNCALLTAAAHCSDLAIARPWLI